jgi:homocysteine S-methyltransferase
MNHTPFPIFLKQSPCILGEGAVIERLRRNSDIELNPHIVNSAFIYKDSTRAALEAIYRQYMDVGLMYRLPLLISTPTWRASQERIASAGFKDQDVNGDNFRYLNALRKSYGAYADKIVICGLLSCRGDAYDPADALAANEASEFHAWQATMLAKAGVDFLLASTLPALSEAIGLAEALAGTHIPYIISFIFRPEGTMLDGTPLKDAIAAIDASVNPKPIAYMANCTHASNFRSAMVHQTNSSALVRERVAGLLANTAALTPEEIDNSDRLIEEDPEIFGTAMAGLYNEMGMKILGGCCGTDERHIKSLAVRLASYLEFRL